MTLDTLAFTTAKSQLSNVMDDVVRNHEPKIVSRHNGKEAMALLDTADLLALLTPFRFDPKVSVSEGTFVIRLPEFDLISSGDSFDEALDELVELSMAYAGQYIRRRAFYAHTDQASQLPWVLRVAFSTPARLRELFVEPTGQVG